MAMVLPEGIELSTSPLPREYPAQYKDFHFKHFSLCQRRRASDLCQ